MSPGLTPSPSLLELLLLILVNVCCQDKQHTACGFVGLEITQQAGERGVRGQYLRQTNEVVADAYPLPPGALWAH